MRLFRLRHQPLLAQRRFLPLFIAQALEAFNDNALRSALIIIATFQIAGMSASTSGIINNLSALLFTLPFLLFSSIAGQMAEKYNKAHLTRTVKWIEVGCMLLAAVGIMGKSIPLMLIAVFFMGCHSTLFGPTKFAILPEQLKPEELITGNAWIESSTFLTILLGYLFGIYVTGLTHGDALVSSLLILTALTGLASSFFIPDHHPAVAPTLTLRFHVWREARALVRAAREHTSIFSAILVISWFWYFGITLMNQFSDFTRYNLHATPDVVALLIGTLAIGISAGAFTGSTLLKGKNSLRYTPMGMLGMSVFTFMLVHSAPAATPMLAHATPDGIRMFLADSHHWLMITELFMLSASGGLYILPLYVLLQEEAPDAFRGRIIACNNMIGALSMFVASGIAMLLSAMHFSATGIYWVTAMLNLGAAVYVCKLLPHALLQSLFKWIIQFIYDVKIEGMENYEKAGKRVIIIANHSSFLDVPLLACFLPQKLSFAINSHVASQPWMRPFLSLSETFIMASDNPMAIKSLIREASQDKHIVIFPEGRITTTGSLMKIYEGPALVADKTQATVLPIRIDGVQYTRFARAQPFLRRFLPRLKITICPPEHFTLPEEIKGRERRQMLSLRLHDTMTNMMYDSSNKDKTLFESLLVARKLHGKKRTILEDAQYKQLSYDSLITKSYVVGKAISKNTLEREHVGLMIANSLALAVCFFGLQALNRVPAMINFTAGFKSIYNACLTAKIKTIITAHKFIETAKLEDLVDQLEAHDIRIVYMEDIASGITLTDKIGGLLRSRLNFIYREKRIRELDANDPAVVLFTSGSEGTPKGVVLSHRNIQANRFQVLASVDVSTQDVLFNMLPMFHSFGLTMGTLLPVLSGIKTVLYPSPLHYRIIPEMIYDRHATILFATNTFLAGYARCAHAYDLHSIRYIFAGAEKLRDATRAIYNDKFGIRILEGYGVTEAAPVVAVNTPMHFQHGSVGRILPSMNTRIEPVEGITEGGRLLLSGPNIMLGYLKADKPGVLQPAEAWYDTGDIVSIDDEGFIRILGRAKRFAKLGGEMVSLSAIESMVQDCWPNHLHAVISIHDDKKGEQLLLISENPDATVPVLIAYAKKHGFPELMVPKKIIHQKELPVLGAGKVDYVTLQQNHATTH